MKVTAKFSKITGYIRNYGVSYAVKKIYYRYKVKYKTGKKYCPFEMSEEERKKEELYKNGKKAKISIIVPVFNTPKEYLVEMIESVIAQTYQNWELCLADASEDEYDYIADIIDGYRKKDARIKYEHIENNLGISINSNKAADMAKGDYITLLDHDDLLHPSALYYIAKAIDDGAEFIYTDELSFDKTTDRVQSINFKPDFSWETFRYNNFICHLTAFKKELFDMVGGFQKEFDGAQDYDLFFRVLEKTDKIVHVQKVLYYWRIHAQSSASGIAAKPYIINAGIRALEAHLKREKIPYSSVTSEYGHGPFYKVNYKIVPKKRIKIFVKDAAMKDFVSKNLADNESYEIYIEIADDKKTKILTDFTYDIVIIARSGYMEYGYENQNYRNFIEELISCLEPKENMAVSNTIVDEKGRYENAGWCHSNVWMEKIRPICKGVPAGESGYMNRLHFRQAVSLLDGSIIALKKEIFVRWYENKSAEKQKDIFSQKSWFEMCMEVEKTGGYNIVTPYYPAKVDSKIIKNQNKAQTDIIFEKDDKYFNCGMEKFGKEYLFW